MQEQGYFPDRQMSGYMLLCAEPRRIKEVSRQNPDSIIDSVIQRSEIGFKVLVPADSGSAVFLINRFIGT